MAINPINAEHDSVVDFIAATVGHAHHAANVTAAFISTLPVDLQTEWTSWPSVLLLEVSAVACIWSWEERGIKESVDSSLPDWMSAWGELVHRLQTQPERFIAGETPLLSRVLRAWMSCYLRHSWDSLRMSIVLEPEDEDRLVRDLAKLLWNCRHLARA